jgi:hypothetical protein
LTNPFAQWQHRSHSVVTPPKLVMRYRWNVSCTGASDLRMRVGTDDGTLPSLQKKAKSGFKIEGKHNGEEHDLPLV